MLKINSFIFLFIFFSLASSFPQVIDLSNEYSMDEFQNGVRVFHNGEFEQAITYFLKSLGYNADNNLARYFLGESYRKAGYEKNAIFTWNNLLALGYKERSLRSKIAYLYNKRGVLTNININKKFLLREDIKGYYNETSLPIFIKPSQITVDINNHYYIASFLTGMIVEMDPNFNIVKNHFPLGVKIKKPFGVAVDKEGYIYISDFMNDVVLKLNKLGIIEGKIGFKGIGPGGLLGPEYLLFDDEENLYVVDSGNHRINKYRKNGDILFSFGSAGTGKGKIIQPAGMYYFNNKIYVCDRGSNKIMIFDKSGNYISSFGEDKLNKPYDITRDRFGRFLILCERQIWAYEEDNALWYVIDALGDRLKRGISIVTDKENNILITDYNTSRLFVLSHERERYTNLNVNIERIFSQKFPDVHIALTIEKDDFTAPTGVDAGNITIFENGKMINLVGRNYTEKRDKKTDILIIYEKNKGMAKYQKNLRLIIDNWLRNIDVNTRVSLVSIKGDDAILENDFNSTRLSILDSIDDTKNHYYTDKGSAIKFGIYSMLRRFSKKAVILVTNSYETGKDFNKFKLENCIALARNNNIPIYIVSFAEDRLSKIYKYIAKKTEGDYYRVYERSDLKDLFKRIEESKGKEIIFSYKSRTTSRFGEEPISVTIEVDYGGMNGFTKSIYYPSRQKPFFEIAQ